MKSNIEGPFIRPKVWWGWLLVPIAWPVWTLCWMLLSGLIVVEKAFGDPTVYYNERESKK